MVRYSEEEVKQQFDDWVAGNINKDDMTLKQWRAFKRRINRRGFKKTPEMFMTSCKGVSNEEHHQKILAYRRARYRRLRNHRRAVQNLRPSPALARCRAMEGMQYPTQNE